jgi:hypothetical protein
MANPTFSRSVVVGQLACPRAQPLEKRPAYLGSRHSIAVLAASHVTRFRRARVTFLSAGIVATEFSVLHLFRVDLPESARRHGIAGEDIVHAYEHTIGWVRLGDDPPRYLLAGGDRAGNLLELVVIGVRTTLS